MPSIGRIGRSISLDNQVLFFTAVVLSVIPLWIPEFLPLVDVPQHSAQVASARELLSGNGFIHGSLEINWFTPYLGGYFFLYIVSTILPIVPATKLVVSVAVAAVPVVTGLILRSIGADERLKWLAIPASFSFAMYWGFMVYLVAVPLALALLLLTVHFAQKPDIPRGAGIALFSIVLFFFHVVALGFGAFVSLAYLFAKNFRRPLLFLKYATPYTAPIPLILLWLSRQYENEASVQGTTIVFGPIRLRLTVLFEQIAGTDGVGYLVALVVAAVVLIAPVAFGYRISRRIERWFPLLAGLLVYMAFPYYVLGTAYLYQRMAVFLIPLWLIVWDRPERNSQVGFALCVLLALGTWSVFNLNRFMDFAEESDSFSRVLHAAEPGRRMAGMIFCNMSESFRYPVYLHFHAWYQAKFRGIADNSFAMTHPSMVRYRDLASARVGDRLAWMPWAFDWSRDGGSSYDYFIVCADDDVSGLLFKDRSNSVGLVAHEPPWWLYENREPARRPIH
jgi:hypothetical protein